MTTALHQSDHLKSLTGLRFLAAFSVFVAHVGVHWPQYELGTLPFGAAGVGFFYVLSGFILTYVYSSRSTSLSGDIDASELQSSFSFRQFYLRRFARIWPLHVATLLLSLFFVIGTDSFFNRPNPIGKLFLNSLLIQSWIPNYEWVYSLNGPSWSLAVEAFFYAAFPFLLLGGGRRFIGKYVLIVVGTIVAIVLINQFVPRTDSWVELNAIVHANPLLRLFEFATGVGCGFLFLNRKPTHGARSVLTDSSIELLVVGLLIGFFAIANSLGMYAEKFSEQSPIAFQYWFRFSGAAPVFAVVIFVFAKSRGVFSKPFSSQMMVYLGEISYSFYMVHMGVMLVLKRIDWIEGPWVGVGSIACSLVFSLFLASILYHLIELPFRRALVNGSAVSAWRTSLVNWIRTPWLVPLILMSIVGGWFVSANRFDIRDQRRIATIVEATELELQNVRFGDDAVLLGVRTQTTAAGSIHLELAWHLKPGRRSERFIKLLDAQGNVIGRGDPNRALFGSIDDEETVIDRVEIEASKMQNVVTIAVGFFDRERKAAVVDRGPRSARDRQLHVWSSN